MDVIASLFREVGGRDYIGEAVSQEQHALQCAKFAADAGADDDTVLAALMHDVGHLLGLQDPESVTDMEGGLGVKDHERIGASWLITLGLSAKTAELVRRHVDAKRYLCFKNPAYHNKLSEASKGTLVQQGGVMSAEEAEFFEKDPLMDTIIKMRTWDEKAKVVNPTFHVPDLESYRPMFERALERQRQYMQDKEFEHYKLSHEQLEFWRANGYIKLSDLLSEEKKAQVVSWVDEIQKWEPTPGKHMLYYENDSADDGNLMLCRTENFLPYHDEMRKLLDEQGPVMDVLEQLMNEPAVLFKEKINYKKAGGGGFPAHVDAPAFNSFGQRNHLTLNIAVDKAVPENGCLEVAPGYHTKGPFEQDPVHFGLSKEAEQACHNWMHVPLMPGDALLFSSWLPHRSGPNRSDQSRRALYVTYNGQTDGCFREQYYETKRREFPQACERDPNKDYSEAAKTFNLATPIVG